MTSVLIWSSYTRGRVLSFQQTIEKNINNICLQTYVLHIKRSILI